MERNTLSNYGWIIICVLVLSVMLAFASPFGKYVGEGIVSIVNGFRAANDSSLEKENIEMLENEWSDKLNDPNSNYQSSDAILEDLQTKHNFLYYSSIESAVTDVNNNTIGQNANSDKNSAEAGIYEENGQKYIVLLKDALTEERMTLNSDMTINLGGNKLETTYQMALDIYSNVTIDGSIRGSEIKIDNTEITEQVNLFQIRESSCLTANGGKYTINVPNSNHAAANCFRGIGNLIISNVDIKITTNQGIPKAIYTKGNVNISNSNIVTTSEENNYSIITGKSSVIKDSSISTTSLNKSATAIFVNEETDATITNVNIYSYTKTGNADAIKISQNSTANISNCDVLAETDKTDEFACACALTNAGTAIASNSKFIANANYTNAPDGTYGALSIGVSHYGETLTINNCEVFGTHSGMSTSTPIYIDGGKYSSIGHGGIYFCGENITSYAKNVTSTDALMPEGYYNTCGATYAGIYIGGGEGNDNLTIYMDNCHLYGGTKSIVLRGTSGEKNNSLYISNSIIDETYIRIDNNTHRLYVGENCNVNLNKIFDNTDVELNLDEVIVFTNENYTY